MPQKTERRNPSHSAPLMFHVHKGGLAIPNRRDLPDPGAWRPIGHVEYSASTKTFLGTVRFFVHESPDHALATRVEWQPPPGGGPVPLGAVVEVTNNQTLKVYTKTADGSEGYVFQPITCFACDALVAADMLPAVEAPQQFRAPMDVLDNLGVDIPAALTAELARCVERGNEYGLFMHRNTRVVRMNECIDLRRRHTLDASDLQPNLDASRFCSLGRLVVISDDDVLTAWRVGSRGVIVLCKGDECPVLATPPPNPSVRVQTGYWNAESDAESDVESDQESDQESDTRPLRGASDLEDDSVGDTAPLPTFQSARIASITLMHGIVVVGKLDSTDHHNKSMHMHKTVSNMLATIEDKRSADTEAAERAARRVRRRIEDPEDSPWVRGREAAFPDEWLRFCAVTLDVRPEVERKGDGDDGDGDDGDDEATRYKVALAALPTELTSGLSVLDDCDVQSASESEYDDDVCTVDDPFRKDVLGYAASEADEDTDEEADEDTDEEEENDLMDPTPTPPPRKRTILPRPWSPPPSSSDED